jgi:hypothetical protein
MIWAHLELWARYLILNFRVNSYDHVSPIIIVCRCSVQRTPAAHGVPSMDAIQWLDRHIDIQPTLPRLIKSDRAVTNYVSLRETPAL